MFRLFKRAPKAAHPPIVITISNLHPKDVNEVAEELLFQMKRRGGVV